MDQLTGGRPLASRPFPGGWEYRSGDLYATFANQHLISILRTGQIHGPFQTVAKILILILYSLASLPNRPTLCRGRLHLGSWEYRVDDHHVCNIKTTLRVA